MRAEVLEAADDGRVKLAARDVALRKGCAGYEVWQGARLVVKAAAPASARRAAVS